MSKLSFSEQEIRLLRSATPGVRQVIHFNNAGAALMPEVVGITVIKYIQHEMNYGGYETAEKYSMEIEAVYSNLAKYLGCMPSEIAIMENATAAWEQAFLSIPFEPGDCILTSVSEYASNYIPFLQQEKRMGVTIEIIPSDSFGQVDITALAAMVHGKVKLIAVTHVPTNGGLVNPAAKIGAIAKEHGIWYLLDACQSVGQMPLNVEELGCDFLSATSRKYLRGPRGVGFLYVSQNKISALEPAVLDLHGADWLTKDTYSSRKDARKFENWESNFAGVVGLAKAVEYMLELGVDRIWARIRYLADYLRSELSNIPGIEVHDLGETKCGIVSFTSSTKVESLKIQIQQAGFNVSIIHPRHTLLDMQERDLGLMIRASVHYYNTEEEVDRFVEYLRGLV